ncbi:MAG: hypothetical protein ABSG53_31570 [Thermoguttaceae bacterium]
MMIVDLRVRTPVLECGGLLPLSAGERTRRTQGSSQEHGQQAGLVKSGSKLRHSRASA